MAPQPKLAAATTFSPAAPGIPRRPIANPTSRSTAKNFCTKHCKHRQTLLSGDTNAFGKRTTGSESNFDPTDRW